MPGRDCISPDTYRSVPRAALALTILAGCYDPPQPACTFVCGPGGACPDDYTCAADHRCHRNGAADSACAVAPDGGGGAPVVLSTDPVDGALDVAVDVMPTALVTEDLLGVTDQTMYMLQGSTPVPGHAVYAASSKQPRFVPDLELDEQGLYTVVIAAGITSVTGQPLAPYAWTFHTGTDTAPPRVASTMPANGAMMVATSTNIAITFDEPVTGAGATTITAMSPAPVPASVSQFDATTYTLVPASNLPASATITITVGPGISDLHGNAMAPFGFSFTTAP